MRRDPGLADYITFMRISGLSPNTIGSRACTLRGLAAAAGKPLLRLTADDLLRWRLSLRVSPDAAVTYMSNVRAFYAWAVDTGRLRVSPAARIPLGRRARRVPRPFPWPDLVRAVEAAPPDIRLMLVLASWLGLRCCEIASLRWESVSVDSRVLVVLGKGGKERPLELSDWLVAELGRYGVQQYGWVFRRRDGGPGPVAAHRVSQLLRLYLRDLGIAARAHQGRHFFATETLRACHDLRVVQELMGHALPQSTAIYAMYDRPTAAAAIAALPVPAGLDMAA